MPFLLRLLILAIALASGGVRADCELLYAPPETRARLLAFHYANELRRGREPARGDIADTRPTPEAVAGRPGPGRSHSAPARSPTRPR